MKWRTALLLAAALTAVFGLPFREYETRRLLPLQTVQAEQTARGVHIVSEAGEGWGADWAQAVADLRERADGDVFFETAELAVFRGADVAQQAVLSGDLRPAARVCFSPRLCAPEEAPRLAQQAAGTVAELRASYLGEVGA